MATMSDCETFEKTIVFGGITHSRVGVPQYITKAKSQSDKKSPSKKERIEFKTKLDTKFADLDKELAMLVTESNIHTTKQEKLTSGHNNLNYKVLNFFTENSLYRAKCDILEGSNVKNFSRMEKLI